jgi:hypothetical protein
VRKDIIGLKLETEMTVTLTLGLISQCSFALYQRKWGWVAPAHFLSRIESFSGIPEWLSEFNQIVTA